MDIISLFNIIDPAWWLLLLLPLVGYICWKNPYEYNSLAATMTAIGGNEATIMIPNEQIIDDNLIIPANITLRFIQGGYLNIAVGKTVTINGHVEAGLYQIFEGAGLVVFGAGSVREVSPEWWGDNTTPGTTEMTDIINKAINSVFANVGKVSFVPYQIYYIGGGSNAPYDGVGDTYDDGIRIRSNVILEGNNCLLTSDQGGATPADQFRIITNYCGDVTSENFAIRNFRLKHIGTAGFYNNGIWINGGSTAKAEHWVNNILLENIYCEDLRVGVIIRDNQPHTAPIADNDLRRVYNVKVKNLVGKDCTSALITPDGDNIQIDSVRHDASGAASSHDTIAIHRGHNITVDDLHSFGLISGYGIMVRNSIGSHTKNVNVSNVISDGGKGVKIGTESAGTPSTEVIECIKFDNILVRDGAFIIDKSLEDITLRRIELNNIDVDIGTVLDGLAGIGMRIFALTTFATGVEDIKVNNLTIKDPTGICFHIQNSQGIKVSNFKMSRDDQTASLIKLNGNVQQLSMNHGELDTGDIGIDIFGASATIKARLDDIKISGTNKAIDWDVAGSVHEVLATKIKTTDPITFPTHKTSYHELFPGYGATLTIVGDAIAITHQRHVICAEVGVVDNLDTITPANGNDGQMVTLVADVGDTITVKHVGGNIRTKVAGDVTVTSILPITLMYNGIQWSEI